MHTWHRKSHTSAFDFREIGQTLVFTITLRVQFVEMQCFLMGKKALS